MATITFMIGNGFDLACGLKSKYKDTYEGYIASESKSQTIAVFKETIESDIPTWADFEMQLAKYAKDLKSEDDLVLCQRDYDEYLNDYLKEEQQRFWDHFGFLLNSDNAVLREMIRSLTTFYHGLTQNDIQTIITVLQSDAHLHLNSADTSYNFISFNYTNIFDRLLDAASDLKKNKNHDYGFYNTGVIHIHGIIGEDVTLGVDNETQLSNLPYSVSFRTKRAVIKPIAVQSFNRSRVTDAELIIRNSNVICVYGLSLGESDLTWRKALATWLKTDKHHLVYYKHEYMQYVYHSAAITEKMDVEDDCKETLLSLLYTETLESDEKEEILTRIHIPVGYKIFDFEKAFLDAELEEKGKDNLRASLLAQAQAHYSEQNNK